VWTSWSDSGLESTRTSAFQCPTLQLGGGKNVFFLRNDVDEPLPMFSGNHPIPQLNWGYDVAQR
jgi:hypothetical protein